MKYILILSLLTGLFSCSAYYHTRQAEKHTQKALNKGATLTSDTTYLTISDTLTEIDTIDNYIRITQTIRDTVKAKCKTVYIAKSRTEVRQEQKTERTKVRQEAKTMRKANKQAEKTKRKEKKRRSWWWLWLLIGGAVTLIVQRILKL